MTMTRPAPAIEQDVMRQALEPMIAQAFRAESPVRAIEWRRFALATSYDAQVVTVRLASGETHRVFVKNFGSTVRPKDDPRLRREREVRVYRDVLAGAGLGTARCYGSVLDEVRGRHWLLLEFVNGTPVGYCDIADAWAPAAAALGRLHGHFADAHAALADRDFLVQHTRDFFWSKAEHAARCVEAIAPERRGELGAILGRYPEVVEVMAAQPRTLIHGGCRSTNILVRVVGDPARVCIVDWEEAAYGAPLYDLAYLLDGIEPPLLDPLLDAYLAEALPSGLVLPARREMKHVIDCFRLHMLMVMLSQATLKGYDATAVAKLVASGGRLSTTLRGGAGQ